jgi:uncharacterized membrane protein YdbT with pleckstrin-like domain
MPYPKKLLSTNEDVVLEFRPHWQALLGPIVLAVIAVALEVVAGVYLSGSGRTWAMVGVAVLFLLLAGRSLLTWFFTSYVITNERLIIRTGILAREGKEIPLDAINDVTFSQSFLERLVGSGDLLIESAGEFGQSRFTNIPDPEKMQSLIYETREQRKFSFTTGGGQSVAQQIETLARLRDQGILSPEEFESQKQKLLSQ